MARKSKSRRKRSSKTGRFVKK